MPTAFQTVREIIIDTLAGQGWMKTSQITEIVEAHPTTRTLPNSSHVRSVLSRMEKRGEVEKSIERSSPGHPIRGVMASWRLRQ